MFDAVFYDRAMKRQREGRDFQAAWERAIYLYQDSGRIARILKPDW